jgi:hypothetical protein
MPHKSRWNIFPVSIALSLSFVTSPAIAADEDEAETFYGRIGYLYTATDTKIRLDDPNNANRGTELDFERDLKFSKGSSIFEADLGINFSDNFAFEMQYFDLDRRTSATLARTITVEDRVFDVNARVDANFGSTVYHGRAVWRVGDWDNGELALMLGLHATRFRVGIEGQARVGTNPGQFTTIVRKKLAPLPTLGARAKLEVAPYIYLFGQGEIFSLKIDNVKGTLVDVEGGLVWEFSDNVGIGVSLRHLDYGLKVERENLLGSIDYRLSGPSVFLTAEF